MVVGTESPVNRGQSLISRVLTAGGTRQGRFRDEAGNSISLSRAVRNGPRAFVTTVLRLTVGYRPQRPWISYDAQAVLDRFLTPESKVLEFGSGMSTIWYARRSAHVVSIESFEPWYKKVGDLLRSAGNVDYRFVPAREAYVSAPEGPFDLIMIDGGWRDGCAESALTQLASGGVIYLDNSDMGHNRETNSDVPRARKLLLDFAGRNGLPVREFTDFAPTQFHVQRGLMVGGPKA